MKLTCLSKGDGFHYPPCHMLNLCGFRILIDCPLDLLALTIFSPVPYDVGFEASACQSDVPLDAHSPIQKKQKLERQLSPADLVCAEPWYKTVKSLHLWEDSLIDVVLISNPMGLLGLPFLTQNPRFCAKIYMTEATAKIGELMMEDLVSMHSEYRCFYGPETSSFPGWMKNLDHEDVAASLKKVAFGESGDDLGSWMRLYSLNDIKSCMTKVQVVKFAEEVCYNGTLMIKALSSGLDIGACNWLINGPIGSLSYVSSSIFVSHHAKDFDFRGLKGTDVLIYSDFSYLQSSEVNENDCSSPHSNSNYISTFSKEKKDDNLDASLLSTEDSVEEVAKLAFVCSCAAESADAGGSTLITITRIGIVLQLLELMSNFLESSSLKVPIFVISSVAEELLAYTNIIPEWLCEQRQKMLISGEPSFGHHKFIKDKRIHLFPAIHSPNLITNWQEPCIVFAPHCSLRLGPSVQLLQRWRGDPKSLLVLEDGISSELGLLPFRPIAMKVLQCSFLSGIRLQKLSTLLSVLQPKLVLLPDAVNKRINIAEMTTKSIRYYYENKTLHVQRIADNANVEITTDLASKLSWRKLRQRENFGISRLNGELLMEDGKRRLVSGLEQEKSSGKALSLMHWGSLAPETLLDALRNLGITGSIERSTDENGSEKSSVIHIRNLPCSGLIETSGMSTVVITDNGNVASQIFQAIDGILDGI